MTTTAIAVVAAIINSSAGKMEDGGRLEKGIKYLETPPLICLSI